MSNVTIELDQEIAALLHQLNQPLDAAVRELLVLELYRRGNISSGKAAELLHMGRAEFIPYASRLGIPFFSMTEDEWKAERKQFQPL